MGGVQKLKAGCLHHDNGILGAASFYEAEYRKLELHKDNGYNAIRCAHNPVSAAFLEACDRLGLLVMEEAFDTWNMSKNLHDYSASFAAEWRTELEAFMRRDRSHPSIVMWSIGNELPEQGGLSSGYQTSYELAQAARALDATREENYTVDKIRTYHGRALAVLRAEAASGEAAFRVKTPGLADAEVKLNIS